MNYFKIISCIFLEVLRKTAKNFSQMTGLRARFKPRFPKNVLEMFIIPLLGLVRPVFDREADMFRNPVMWLV
jgi:hypothetical protein